MNALVVDYLGATLKETQLRGRCYIMGLWPIHNPHLNYSGPHRQDSVDRVFVLEGGNGGPYTYRERYWETTPCDCVDGFYSLKTQDGM